MQTIEEQIKTSINPELEIEGLLRTMFDPRNNLANAVSAQLIEHFGQQGIPHPDPPHICLAEAPSFGKPALFHDKESRGALAYLALAGEMIRRDESPDTFDAPDASDVPEGQGAPATQGRAEMPAPPEMPVPDMLAPEMPVPDRPPPEMPAPEIPAPKYRHPKYRHPRCHR